jgi:hypothetical protein
MNIVHAGDAKASQVLAAVVGNARGYGGSDRGPCHRRVLLRGAHTV